MGLIDTIKSKLPSIRRPKESPLMQRIFEEYNWAFQRSSKNENDLSVYYEAYNNVWVRRCIETYSNEALNLGFTIKTDDDSTTDSENSHYLTSLFNYPMGRRSEDTFASLNTKIWKSLLLTGDVFIQVIYDELFENIPIGFNFLPTEVIRWNQEHEAWQVAGNDYIFSDREIIHIYEPTCRRKYNNYGTSPLDAIASSITLDILGLNHNREIFANNGIDPSGVISFDENASPMKVQSTVQRLKNNPNKKGMLILQGGTYQAIANTNKDMDFLNLMTIIRDRIIIGMGLQPSLVGIRESSGLSNGGGESQREDFSKALVAKCRLIEDAFNRILSLANFRERFEYNRMDLEDKQKRVQMENIQIQNGTRTINEVRADYDLEPLSYGDEFYQTQPEPVGFSTEEKLKRLEKALLYEALKDEY